MLTTDFRSQFLTALERPVIVVNLDPAADTVSYQHSVSITSLISLQDAMSAHGLGPNGAMLYCLEYLEANFDWLEQELERALEEGGYTGDKREQAFVVFDTPGQVELSTDHGSLKRIIERLKSSGGWRVSHWSLFTPRNERATLTDSAHFIVGGGASDGRPSYRRRWEIRRSFTSLAENYASARAAPRQRTVKD